ncbi:MAG: hypothetical protein IJT23_11105 [Clostridia bacterium]|nr:hypothetical protein [Clostridia bacterium]
MLKACMKRVEITPPKGLELAGYPHYPRYNEGAHDPLYGACMYLENDGIEAVMVTLDLLFFSKKHTQRVRKKVFDRCGIPYESVMISCSHTHSGPWAAGRLDIESLEAGKEQPKEYIENLIEKIANLICKAKADAYPAQFTSGTAICGAEAGIGGNRRIKGGPSDPTVSVLAIRDYDKNIRGVIANYTLHPTFIHEWSNVCTADYPCYLKMQIEEVIPTAVTGFTQGTSGNQSSRYYRKGESHDEAQRVGRTLGKAVLSVLEDAEWTDFLYIKIATDSIEYQLRDFGTEAQLRAQVEHDRAVYEELYAKYGQSNNREEYYLWQNANLKCLGSEDQLGYILLRKKGLKVELLDDENPSQIQIIRLGNTCVIGIQGEVFVEYGLYLKAMAGFGTVIINELSNGVAPGYLYTPESLVTGGYETDTSMIDENFGRKFIDKILDTVQKVKQEV